MAKRKREVTAEDVKIKDFVSMTAPSVINFYIDHFICGNTHRCVWAIREYPTSTNQQALLRHLGEKDDIILRIYTRHVTPNEERKIIHNAANKNRMARSNTNDLQQTVTAESNLQDVTNLVESMHRNREPLLHCAVYIELMAQDYDALKILRAAVSSPLVLRACCRRRRTSAMRCSSTSSPICPTHLSPTATLWPASKSSISG